MAKNIHVTPDPHGKWQVKIEKTNSPIVRTPTQKVAIDIGRQIAKERHSELVIHRPNGQIRAKDSHGHDPCPPKG